MAALAGKCTRSAGQSWWRGTPARSRSQTHSPRLVSNSEWPIQRERESEKRTDLASSRIITAFSSSIDAHLYACICAHAPIVRHKFALDSFLSLPDSHFFFLFLFLRLPPYQSCSISCSSQVINSQSSSVCTICIKSNTLAGILSATREGSHSSPAQRFMVFLARSLAHLVFPRSPYRPPGMFFLCSAFIEEHH